MLDRSIAPKIILVTDVVIAQASSHELANGVICHYVNAGTQPVVRLEIVFPAGSIHTHQSSLAAFTAGMMTEGTTTKTSAQIANMVAFYGAELECSASSDRAILTLYALKKHLPDLLPLVVDIMTNATFPKEEIENQRTIRIRNLELQQQKTSYLASTYVGKALYGEAHPYGRIATKKALEEISRDDLIGFYSSSYKAFTWYSGLFEVIASGMIDAEVMTWIDESIGQVEIVQTSAHPEMILERYEPLKEKEVLIPKEGTQSTIRIAAQSIDQEHEDIYNLVFLKEALGGYFGSRLMKNIREDKGYTYGIYAQLIHGKEGSRLQIGADVGIDVTQAALNEIYHEMQVLIDEPIPPHEMELIRGNMMGSLAGAVTNAFSLSDCFKTVHFGGVDYSYFENLKQTIRTVSSKEIQETAAKYLQRELFCEIVAGGK